MNIATIVGRKGDTTGRRRARFIGKLCVKDVARTVQVLLDELREGGAPCGRHTRQSFKDETV
jgi:hypothetical protein